MQFYRSTEDMFEELIFMQRIRDDDPSMLKVKTFWPDKEIFSTSIRTRNRRERAAKSHLPATFIKPFKTPNGHTLYVAGIEGYIECLLGNTMDATLCDFAPRKPRQSPSSSMSSPSSAVYWELSESPDWHSQLPCWMWPGVPTHDNERSCDVWLGDYIVVHQDGANSSNGTNMDVVFADHGLMMLLAPLLLQAYQES